MPSATVRVGARAPKMMLGGETTFSEKLAERMTPPPLAVTTQILAPALAAGEAVRVTKPVPDPGTSNADGTKLATTPAGRPLTLRLTGALKPPTTATEKLRDVEVPRVSETVGDFNDRLKLGTLTVKDWLRCMPPPAALTTNV